MTGRVLLALALAMAGSGVGAQAPSSTLVLLAVTGDYPGETYTAGPAQPAEAVFFEGEPVAIDVRVANWGDAPALLTGALDARAVGVTVSMGARSLQGRLDSVWRDQIDDSVRLDAAGVTSLPPGDAIRWRFMIDEGVLEAGWHQIRADATVVDATGGPVRRQRAEFVIEVRRRESAEPAELARRIAEWLTAQKRFIDARAATDVLERVYPDSVAVHLIRSRIADAVGDDRLSRRELDLALAFMRQERDTLFRRYARPGQIEDLIESLRP